MNISFPPQPSPLKTTNKNVRNVARAFLSVTLMQHFLLFSRCVSFTLFLFFSFCMHFFSFYFLFLLAFAFDCVVHFFFFSRHNAHELASVLHFYPFLNERAASLFLLDVMRRHIESKWEKYFEKDGGMKERMRKKAVDWSSNAFFFVDRVGDWGLAFGQVSFYGACLFWLAPPALCFKTQKSFF